jgi:aminoglycoside phosphotransferase (APT) family kinase protein
MQQSEFEALLGRALTANVEWCRRLVAVERLSGGASQETYRLSVDGVDGPAFMALRRAPGGIGKEDTIGPGPGLATEALLMQAAQAVGVPEPEVYYVLQPADGLGEGFAMEWFDGEALGAKIARAPEFETLREGLAYQCGKILARIHSVDLDASGLRDRLDAYSPLELMDNSWQRYQAYPTPQPMIDYAARWLQDNAPERFDNALVHNDFRNGNFMVDERQITAVLDWEVAHIGDPMRDLGWICTNSWRFGRTENPVGGFGEYADLFRGYEEESGTRVDPERVRYWEVNGSFWWAVGCLGMAEHYRHGPDQTVERPGIGRRSSECQVDCVNMLIPGPVELVEGIDLDASSEMPRLNELLISVRDFLREDVMAATAGRTNFLARVAGNSLDIVLRDLALGERARAAEHGRLQQLLGASGDFDALRWQLVGALRDGSMALDNEDLQAHLRQTVVNQVAIDQPRYTGLKTALSHS